MHFNHKNPDVHWDPAKGNFPLAFRHKHVPGTLSVSGANRASSLLGFWCEMQALCFHNVGAHVYFCRRNIQEIGCLKMQSLNFRLPLTTVIFQHERQMYLYCCVPIYCNAYARAGKQTGEAHTPHIE